jgi:modulator of FtsH protease HflK
MSRTFFNKIGVKLSDLWGRGTDSEEEERSYRDKKKPPELDKLWQKFNERLSRLFGRNGGRNPNPATQGAGLAAVIFVLICVVVWLISGLVIIAEGDEGLVLTFGKHTETKQPGLSWRWPYPIQSVEVVNKMLVRKVEIGYRASEKNKQLKEALMPTSDGNVVDLQFAVQYRLKSASDWAFNNAEQEEMVKHVAESAIREIVGKNKMDYVLYEGREKIANEVSQAIQTIFDRYSSGVLVTSVTVQSAQGPEQVQASFDDIQKATQDRKRMESEGNAYADDILPKAKGVASRVIQDAEAYRARVIAYAEGDTARFKQIYAEYQKAPVITRDRMYIETMQHIYSKATKVVVDAKNGNNVMYLPLDKMMLQNHPGEDPKPVTKPPQAETVPAEKTLTEKTPAEKIPGSVPPASSSLLSFPTARERDARSREAR